MPAISSTSDRITISEHTLRAVRSTSVPARASLVLRDDTGAEIELPESVQHLLISALTSVADHGDVSIGRVPDQLTSTVAAQMLGISRPTLMKWVRDGRIPSFTVGTHTRFAREDVLRVRAERQQERRSALASLREFDAENEDVLGD